MLAVAKTPRTNLKFEGYIPQNVLVLLKEEFGKALKIKKTDEEDELVDFFSMPRVK